MKLIAIAIILYAALRVFGVDHETAFSIVQLVLGSLGKP